jgi:hypothetical protein
MPLPSVSQLIPVLQTAIGPVILISGIGLLLLSMTNRLGRVIDRSRALAAIHQASLPADRTATEGQLAILWQRARTIRLAISLATISALLAAILIIVLFFTALWQVDTALLIAWLFVGCLLCLILSLALFLRDVYQSLAALRLELDKAAEG